MTEKTVVLKLHDVIINPDGTHLKDASKETRSQEELVKLTPEQIVSSYPDFTVGMTLIGLINAKQNVKSVEEMSKLSTLLTKLRNKTLTNKGEWHVEKNELLELQTIFTNADPKTLSVNVHGQVYNKIQDLLIQATA